VLQPAADIMQISQHTENRKIRQSSNVYSDTIYTFVNEYKAQQYRRHTICTFYTKSHTNISFTAFINVKKEVQVLQRDRVTQYVSKFVLHFMSYRTYKGFNKQK